MIYPYADVIVSSTLPLPELGCGGGPYESAGQVLFTIENLPGPESAPQTWAHLRHPSSGEIQLSWARTGDGFILKFPSLADFKVSADGERITARPCHGCTIATLRHLLLDQVLPRVMAHRGRLVLHASAVQIGDSAIAFAGPSGRGKSTLAAGLHAGGLPVVTDDGLVLTDDGDKFLVRALYPGLRLWPSSIAALAAEAPDGEPMAQYSAKRRVQMPNPDVSSKLPLAAIFVLSEPPAADSDGQITASLLPSRDACMEIIRSSFHLDFSDTDRAARLLQAASEVVKILPVFALTYPRDFSRLADVQEVIVRQVERSHGPVFQTATTSIGLP